MKRATSDKGLLKTLLDEGYDFFTGVPDSGLANFIADLDLLPADQRVTATWEAEAVASFTHAHIVQVYAIGESDGLHYIDL